MTVTQLSKRNWIAFTLFYFVEYPLLGWIGYSGGEQLPRWLPSLLIRKLDGHN